MSFNKHWKDYVLVVLLFAIIILTIFNYKLLRDVEDLKNQIFEYNYNNKFLNTEPKFTLVSPNIAWMNVDEFLEKQKTYSVSYQNLKEDLNDVINKSNGTYGIYIEDLSTGAWIGINEKEKFIPASLLKVPTLVAVLKRVEQNLTSLDQVVELNIEDLNKDSGNLWQKGEGYKITVRELLNIMIKDSDNTAVLTLNRRIITNDEYIESRTALGLPNPEINAIDEPISPKEYSTMFRALYHSSYLRRTFSELALSIMLETNFNSQLPAGLPPGTKISHKVGFNTNKKSNHDCGIVYLENKHYIICVMSSNTDSKESDKIISEISRVTYNHMISKR